MYSCSQLNLLPFAIIGKKSLRPRKVHTMNFWDDDAVKILLFSNYGSLDLDMYVVDQN